MASRFEISQQIYNSAYAMHSAHSHSYYELYYLMNGSCNMFIHDNTYRMEAGTILFIPDNVLHKTTYLNNAYHERLYIEFTDDYISDLIDILGFEQFKDTFYIITGTNSYLYSVFWLTKDRTVMLFHPVYTRITCKIC